jgi:hypothetical protein
MTDPDPAATYERLRDETAGMFGYDLTNLSLTQGLQIDLVSLQRLEIDTMQGKVLAGETVDLQRLVAAHGLLAKMLPSSALVAPAAAADNPDPFAGAREELRAFLSQRAEAIERRDRRREAELAANPAKARAEFEATLQRAIENARAADTARIEVAASDVPQPACGDAQSGDAPAGGGLPVLIDPQPPAPPQQTSSQPPPPPKDAPIPAHTANFVACESSPSGRMAGCIWLQGNT